MPKPFEAGGAGQLLAGGAGLGLLLNALGGSGEGLSGLLGGGALSGLMPGTQQTDPNAPVPTLKPTPDIGGALGAPLPVAKPGVAGPQLPAGTSIGAPQDAAVQSGLDDNLIKFLLSQGTAPQAEAPAPLAAPGIGAAAQPAAPSLLGQINGGLPAVPTLPGLMPSGFNTGLGAQQQPDIQQLLQALGG